MKCFLRIKSGRPVSKHNAKWLYETEDGTLFIGPSFVYDSNSTIIVEASEGPTEDGYYHIIKVVGRMEGSSGKKN